MTPEHLDVLIVGAGLSGVGAAVHLKQLCPDRSFAVLEARDAIGGTWDLFRYPGIRSDSDMYTLGYRFKPWTNAKAIADGPSILSYIHETAREYDVDRHIRVSHRVVRASWSGSDARWTVEVERGAQQGVAGERTVLTCSFLFLCTGYYNYEHGYTPDFAGIERFQGRVVHPQKWTPDIDYSGQRVVVIGSGATAVTLVPSMTDRAQHVTMLQRSPTYILALPGQDKLANWMNRRLPLRLAYGITRWKNVLKSALFYRLSKRRPQLIRKLILKEAQRALGPSCDVSKHFSPSYNPWDQRVCLVPDADLFKVIRQGKASVVTDHIETFTERGIRLRSGQELPADLVVTATGLDLLAFGGMEIVVDGRRIEPHDTLSYKGMMLSDVPNLAYAFGYTNASWTLKADLTCEYVCRLLKHLRASGNQIAVARRDPAVQPEPLLDFTSGYVQRGIGRFPQQGDRAPWKLHQNYFRDIQVLRRGDIDDGTLVFGKAQPAAVAALDDRLARRAA
ncbi:MAG: NAD(P)/FAD-dependent oxidoreductase [Burkholderiales bacterium]|nr:NAD(P)/FAD-dependent oxidoreductase [Burkholderiales bacterium]